MYHTILTYNEQVARGGSFATCNSSLDFNNCESIIQNEGSDWENRRNDHLLNDSQPKS